MLSRSQVPLRSIRSYAASTRGIVGLISSSGRFQIANNVGIVRQPVVASPSKMSFHFASSEYAKCFQGLPTPDVPKLRKSAIAYVDSFDKDLWYNDPVSLDGI
jgi:hypothetical protein